MTYFFHLDVYHRQNSNKTNMWFHNFLFTGHAIWLHFIGNIMSYILCLFTWLDRKKAIAPVVLIELQTVLIYCSYHLWFLAFVRSKKKYCVALTGLWIYEHFPRKGKFR